MSDNNGTLLKGKFGAASPSKLSDKDRAQADELLLKLMDETISEATTGYSMMQVLTTGGQLDTVPDILSGGRPRNRRWGVMFTIAVIPGLDKVPEGPVTMPTSPITFFDADSLDDLRERLVHEVDKAIGASKLAMDNPEAFSYVQQEFTRRLQTMMAKQAATESDKSTVLIDE